MPPKHKKDEVSEELAEKTKSNEAKNDTDYHRIRDARDERQHIDLMKQPLNLSTAQKLMGIVLAVVMGVVSIAGTYLVFRATTDYRMSEVEKRVDKNSTVIEHMGQFGFGGHEIRISRLEIRVDNQQQSLSDVKAKLDVAVEILTRMEKKLDTIERVK